MKRQVYFLTMMCILEGIGSLLIMRCSEKGELWSGTEKIVAGVRIVHNPEKGIWQKTKKHGKMCQDFSLSVLEGDPNKEFAAPIYGIAVWNENVYVCDEGNFRIQVFDKNGNFLFSIGKKGEGPGEFMQIRDVAIDKEGNIFTIDHSISRVSQLSPEGTYLSGFNLTYVPIALAIDSKGFLYIHLLGSDFYVNKYNSTGTLIARIGKREEMMDITILKSIDVDTQENLFIAFSRPYKIKKYSSKGELLMEFDRKLPYTLRPGGVAKSGKFYPGDIACTDIAVGLDGRIYVAVGGGWVGEEEEAIRNPKSVYGHSIDVFDSSGKFLDSFWDEKLPYAILGYRLALAGENSFYLVSPYDASVYKYSLAYN